MEQFKGKVKLIYIDPPYNTGNDSFKYNDKFSRSTWLCFMKNRLEIAKKLLKNDGVIFLQCDDNHQAYLKVLMDEVFNEVNFINCIAIKMSEATGVKMNHTKVRFPKLKEYILFYKNDDFSEFHEIDKYREDKWDSENNIFLSNFTNDDRNELINIQIKDNNTLEDVAKANNILRKVKKIPLTEAIKENDFKNEDELNEWLFNNSFRIVKTTGAKSLKNLIENNNIIMNQDLAAFISKKGIIFFYITDYNREANDPRFRVIFSDENVFKNPCDFWQDIKTSGAISNEGDVKLENGKKPEKILHRIIKMITKPNDIVLDFHLGSGTTAAVAHKMNRQYIGIEQMDYIEPLAVERLKNVINGEQSGISKVVNWQGGGDFVYCELAPFNESAKQLIQSCKNFDDLQRCFKELCECYFLKYNLSISQFLDILKEKEFQQLSLNEQKQMMLEMLDLNQLYINFSDMNDSQFENCLSAEDKVLNKQFYGVE